MSRRAITLILPYYENPGMLTRQYQHLAALEPEVKAAVHLIVVDDGSPTFPAERLVLNRSLIEGVPEKGFRTFTPGDVTAFGLASFQLYRIDVDIRWNWIAARNIGVEMATTEWVLLTDIDHLVPQKTFRRIQEQKLDGRRVYRFSRVDAPDLTPYKPHPNSWLMTRIRFDRIGGYDERFSGFYGTDGEFRDRVRLNSREIVILDEPLIRVPREVVPDASTVTYKRKQPEDHAGVTRIRAQIAREGGRPRRLSFPFHRVV